MGLPNGRALLPGRWHKYTLRDGSIAVVEETFACPSVSGVMNLFKGKRDNQPMVWRENGRYYYSQREHEWDIISAHDETP